MKHHLSFIFIVLCVLPGGILFAEFEPNPSTVQFEDAGVVEAQQVYNKDIQEAQQEYADALDRIKQAMQEKVIRIIKTYQKALKDAYKQAKAENNELEAKKIHEEARRVQNEIKKIKGDTETGLVLYFDFNEPPAGNVVKDKSGSKNNGMVRDATWQKDGKLGGCFEFDGKKTDQVILVKDKPSLNCNHITLAAWIKIRQFDRLWNRIFDKNFNTGYDLCVGGFWNNQMFEGVLFIEARKNDGREFFVRSPNNALKIGQWHHVAATFDGQSMKVYIDGKIAGQADRQDPIQTNDSHLAIGNQPPGYVDVTETIQAFDGWIDEVRVYNRGLSEKEINALYAYTPEPDEF